MIQGIVKFLVFILFLSGLPILAQTDTRGVSVKPKANSGEARTALIIGNGNYSDSPLKNPPNDAADMATALKAVGFEVLSYTDLNQNQMKKAIRDFGAKLRAKGGVGLFYYAGHGVQSKGVNYLIPVGATVNTEEEVEYESVEVGLVLAQMESANNNMNIVILDACRNNPFARSFRSADKGLASIDAPSGTLLAYATAPGSVASDGTGRNGLYTQELLKAISTENLSIEDVFKHVRVSVRTATQSRQTPWESSSLTGNFYFSGNANSPPNITAFPERAKPEALPSAEEILGNFSRAIGGEKYREINTITQKGTIEVEFNGQKGTGKVELYQKYPDKSAMISKYSNGAVTKEIFNGNQGWIYGSATGTKEATSQQLDFFKRNLAVSLGDLNTVKIYYPKMLLRGIEKIGDKDAYVIEATKPDGKSETFYFDTSSKLLLRWDFSQSSVSTQSGIEFSTQVYIDDFIDLNGLKVPLTTRQKSANTLITVRFDMTETKFNIPLDDKLFRKP